MFKTQPLSLVMNVTQFAEITQYVTDLTVEESLKFHWVQYPVSICVYKVVGTSNRVH
jgi:hypothetical protein